MSKATKTPRKRASHAARLIGIRLQPVAVQAVDAFIADQSDRLSRPEAIRIILLDWLSSHHFTERENDGGL